MVSYPIRDILDRIERKQDEMGRQLSQFAIDGSKTARDALAEGHELELRVQRLELGAASAAAVRRALWAAGASPLVAAGVAWLLTRR
jgi:hypothetical protein